VNKEERLGLPVNRVERYRGPSAISDMMSSLSWTEKLVVGQLKELANWCKRIRPVVQSKVLMATRSQETNLS
jgi:hypothetical protein